MVNSRTEAKEPASPFSWDRGSWMGTVLGCTLWLMILGLVLVTKDLVAGATSLLCCGLLVAWGAYLWRSRGHLSAYTGIQRFLGVCSVGYGVVILTVNLRGASSPALETGPISTYLPYWALLIAPIMMLFMHMKKRRSIASPRALNDQGSTR